ncbi:MAG: CinA family protein [Aquiluna sp.]|jgi:nicotinamide-nucleotide amidase
MIQTATAKGLMIATAESLTAGDLAARIADTPGASRVLAGGVVSYQDQIKSQLLGVSAQLIATSSAVDPEVAIQMAVGVREKLSTAMGVDSGKLIGISTTGVAGPDPVGSKPVGEVYIGLSAPSGDKVFVFQFTGSRGEIRTATVSKALEILGEEIGNF